MTKQSAASELIDALRAVATKGGYLDAAVASKLVGTVRMPTAVPADAEGLSDREAEVLGLIALGYVKKEIASQLELSVKTVETFKTRSMEKLGLRSRVDIVSYAVKSGWLSPAADE